MLFRIEIKERGTIIKVVASRAKDALDAIDKVACKYPIGPYEFTARKVEITK
jgi:hypothetical protein